MAVHRKQMGLLHHNSSVQFKWITIKITLLKNGQWETKMQKHKTRNYDGGGQDQMERGCIQRACWFISLHLCSQCCPVLETLPVQPECMLFFTFECLVKRCWATPFLVLILHYSFAYPQMDCFEMSQINSLVSPMLVHSSFIGFYFLGWKLWICLVSTSPLSATILDSLVTPGFTR